MINESLPGGAQRSSLSEGQLQVVNCQAPLTLVLGGAGTGKTTAALWAANAALSRRETEPWQRALFLTFSRTAVSQIWDRLSHSELGSSTLREHLEVATFHGFAYHLVRDFGGNAQLRVRSAAEVRLLSEGVDFSDALTYEDLVPAALGIVQRRSVRQLLGKRWTLIICDEFQDTDDAQWELLVHLGSATRLLLLADPNQMIYEDLPGARGIGPQRLQLARASAEVIELPPGSFRDPTNVIPAAAEQIKARRFQADAIKTAVHHGRLSVVRYEDDGTDSRCEAVVRSARILASHGNGSLGVFLHGNGPAAELSAALADKHVTHVLLGISEAQQEALVAMAQLAAFGAGWSDRDVSRQQLAVFVTASRRGRYLPDVAQQLLGRADMSPALVHRLDTLETELSESTDVTELIVRASIFWPSLGISIGQHSWHDAIGTFRAIASSILRDARPTESHFRNLTEQAILAKSDGLTGFDEARASAIRLMNFHQTKGREADATILLFGDSDYFGREIEPFIRLSRLIYVALTRARHEVLVLLPRSPHPIVAPLAMYASSP